MKSGIISSWNKAVWYSGVVCGLENEMESKVSLGLEWRGIKPKIVDLGAEPSVCGVAILNFFCSVLQIMWKNLDNNLDQTSNFDPIL